MATKKPLVLNGTTVGQLRAADNLIIPTELGVGAETIHASAILEVTGDNRGALPAPRLTELQRDGIASPATSLMIFNLDTNKYNFFDGTDWKEIGEGVEEIDGGTY